MSWGEQQTSHLRHVASLQYPPCHYDCFCITSSIGRLRWSSPNTPVAAKTYAGFRRLSARGLLAKSICSASSRYPWTLSGF